MGAAVGLAEKHRQSAEKGEASRITQAQRTKMSVTHLLAAQDGLLSRMSLVCSQQTLADEAFV